MWLIDWEVSEVMPLGYEFAMLYTFLLGPEKQVERKYRARYAALQAAAGVLVLGDHTIGWARLLFNGLEVWRGDTSQIWSQQGRFGGYLDVSGYSPGEHTLRIESMGFDYHPVTVAFFGVSLLGGVQEEE